MAYDISDRYLVVIQESPLFVFFGACFVVVFLRTHNPAYDASHDKGLIQRQGPWYRAYCPTINRCEGLPKGQYLSSSLDPNHTGKYAAFILPSSLLLSPQWYCILRYSGSRRYTGSLSRLCTGEEISAIRTSKHILKAS